MEIFPKSQNARIKFSRIAELFPLHYKNFPAQSLRGW